MTPNEKARTLIAIDRAITSLHPVTVAETIRAAGDSALASQVEHHPDDSWRAMVLSRLDRMPEERLRSIVAMLSPAPAYSSAFERDLERVRGELTGELLGIKRRLSARPILTEHEGDRNWRENLPDTWDEIGPLLPDIRTARDRLRDVADDLRAELIDTEYSPLEIAIVEALVLRGIDRASEALALSERRTGDWHDHRARFSQGLFCLELAIAVMSQAEIGGRLSRPTFAAHALACGVFAERPTSDAR